MKRLTGLSALALIISGTSGCGWLWGDDGYFRDRSSDYLEARQTAPMQLPSNVDAKRLDPLLPVPQQVATNTATGEYEVPRPQPLSVRGEASEFSLQKSGDSRWVVAQRAPAEVWPVARQFFEDNGFRIAEEHPQTGEFVTAWQRFDELSATMARRLSSRVAGVSPDSETRVRVRIEPGVQRNTSEIFVVSGERSAGSTADIDFPSRSVNTSLDGALLDEMKPLASGKYEQLITYVKDRPGHDRRYAIDARKIERELGWRPAETFESGIRKTVQWYLDHADWVADVQSGGYRDWLAKNYACR